MASYDHRKIEKKWQKIWDKSGIYKADGKHTSKEVRPKFYGLIEFPFPSGEGMHTGHLRSNTAMDIIARKRRAEGFDVLYPIGWDAFGLPTENYAIKTGIHPKIVSKRNIDNFRRQLKSAGFSFDWSREVNTSDPAYYKWTQWVFLQMYKKGLAYKKKMLINWCPKDKIGLANEEVIDGTCERCGGPVEKREKEQWMLAITKYADRLDKDLDTVNYLEKIKTQQRNWIGKSEGTELNFEVCVDGKKTGEKITVFTTRPDTLFGVTYVVLAPEHPFVAAFLEKNTNEKNKTEIREYSKETKNRPEIERTATNKEKTGISLGAVTAINPATKEQVPVWVADYVLPNYGTGAVMAVPAHDDRDFAFAKKYSLPIKEVIIPKCVDVHDPPKEGKKTVERRAVQAIVVDPKTSKVLCLKWKKFPWSTFVTGGVEKDESIIEAATREIREETGYQDFKYVRTLGGPVESHFFAAHKDENRKALFSALVFELQSDARTEMSEEEKAIHEVHWVSWDEFKADKNIKCAEYDIWLDRFFNSEHAFTSEGILIDSGSFSGKDSQSVLKEITEFAGGKLVSTFKLRDWVFSRQRYWGEPIPMVYCENCKIKHPKTGGWIPVPEKNLPVKLPNVKNYLPTDTGESPLAAMTSWVNTKCPVCKSKARRETDTMPNWAGSSWYFLRYSDPKNKKALASSEKLAQWMPVDWYNGGMEHTTLHLLYSRFWNKFLFDIGVAPTSEPYQKRTSHGFILAENGEKMSKSRGNVVNPDQIIENYGADTLRLYEMFMAPFDQAVSWDTKSIIGPRRFLEKIWRLREKVAENKKTAPSPVSNELENLVHKTIQKVSDDIETMQFNTAVSALMILANEMEKTPSITLEQYKIFLRLLAPFAPHICDELWQSLGGKKSIHLEPWAVYDPAKIVSENVVLIIQVNGKTRDEISVAASLDEEKVKEKVLEREIVKKWVGNTPVKRIIFVKNRLVNIVI